MHRKVVPDVVNNQTVEHLPPDSTVRAAAVLMLEKRIGALLVMADGRLEGIFTERDALYRVMAESRDPDATPVSEVMTANPDCIAPDCSAIEALRMMERGGYRHLPIVAAGTVVGIVSRRDFFGSEKQRVEDDDDKWSAG